jgi:serine phosphatase RsbU (regulator of sigma subunit)
MLSNWNLGLWSIKKAGEKARFMMISGVDHRSDLIDHFASGDHSAGQRVLADVREYLNWQSERQEEPFMPSATDDVVLRTYLLHLRIQRANRKQLASKIASLRKFYNWAAKESLIEENPFDEFDFNRPFLSRTQIRRRQDIFTGKPQDKEIAYLRVLNSLGEAINKSADVQSALNEALKTLVGALGLRTAWAFLTNESELTRLQERNRTHDFFLAAAVNLPPGLERDQRFYLTKPPNCHCQDLLMQGKLERAVNIVECTRLQTSAESNGDNRGLLFHASLPLRVGDKAIGVVNFATEEWQFLTAADLQLLTAAGEQVSNALERAHYYDLLRAHQERLERELSMARAVQASFLPENPPEIPGYQVATAWDSALEVAGDFYDFFELPRGDWGMVIADVADKGVPAALYMAMARGLIRTHAVNTPSPARLLKEVNDALCELSTAGMFVTAFYGILDPDDQQLTYALAGHNPPFVRHLDGAVEEMGIEGIALGVLPEAEYSDRSLDFQDGDLLVVYTDGVTDALNLQGEAFGLQRWREVIAQAPFTAGQCLQHLRNRLLEFTQGAPQFDDITLIVISH